MNSGDIVQKQHDRFSQLEIVIKAKLQLFYFAIRYIPSLSMSLVLTSSILQQVARWDLGFMLLYITVGYAMNRLVSNIQKKFLSYRNEVLEMKGKDAVENWQEALYVIGIVDHLNQYAMPLGIEVYHMVMVSYGGRNLYAGYIHAHGDKSANILLAQTITIFKRIRSDIKQIVGMIAVLGSSRNIIPPFFFYGSRLLYEAAPHEDIQYGQSGNAGEYSPLLNNPPLKESILQFAMRKLCHNWLYVTWFCKAENCNHVLYNEAMEWSAQHACDHDLSNWGTKHQNDVIRSYNDHKQLGVV